MPMPWAAQDIKHRQWGSQYAEYNKVHVDRLSDTDAEVMAAPKETIARWFQQCTKEDGRWVLETAGSTRRFRNLDGDATMSEAFSSSFRAPSKTTSLEAQEGSPATRLFSDDEFFKSSGASQSLSVGNVFSRALTGGFANDSVPPPTVVVLESVREDGPNDLDRESSRVTTDLDREDSRLTELQGVPLLGDFKLAQAAAAIPEASEHSTPRGTPRGLTLGATSNTDQSERDIFFGLSELERQEVEVPIVQFGAYRHFCIEGDENVQVEVFRIGNLERSSSVAYETRDGSAKAGVIYEATKGVLVFEPGEHRKEITVNIMDDDSWNPATDFNVVLLNAGRRNAVMGRYLWQTRVSVMDDDAFPTNKYREALERNMEARSKFYFLGKLENVPKAGLLLEYFKLNLRDPVVWSGSIKLLICDQLHNLYLFLLLFLKVYMVDFVLTESTPTERLILTDNRVYSLVLIMVMTVVPFAFLHYLDYIRFSWRVRGASKKTLQGAIIRKFLAFRSQVRADLSQGTLILAMTRDCSQLVDNGYMATFLMAKAIGSIVLMISYQFISPIVFQKELRMTACYAMCIHPIFLSAFIYLRSAKNMQYLEEANDRQDELVCHVDNIVLSVEVISDYDARQPFVAEFEKKIVANNNQFIATAQLMMNNTYFAPWLSLCVVIAYTIKGGIDVLQGTLSLGIFLTNIQIFHDVGVSWGTVYNIVLQLQNSIPRLERVTTLLNFPIDLPQRMNLFKFRTNVTRKLRSEIVERPCSKLPVDLLPIRIIDPIKMAERLSIHVPHSEQNCELSLQQGRLIYILGPHGEGKSTLLRLLSGTQLSNSNDTEEHLVFVPSHLRTLHVSSEPIFFEGTLYDNLVLGVDEDDKDRDPKRVQSIVRRLGIPQLTRDEITNGEVKLWNLKLSPTQRQLLSLARALIANPEVLCVQKPIQALDEFTAMKVLELFREFVDNKGIESDAIRPRTCIITSSRKMDHKYADTIMVVRANGVEVVKDEERELR